jgi:dihydroorotate dehydrogenase electron transfer subunit
VGGYKIKMSKNIYIGEILKNEEVTEDCFLLSVALHSSFADPQPGQFVMLRISGLSEPFLSRPFSIYSFVRNKQSCSIDILYNVVGKGTQILSGIINGTQVEVIGPLGNGFNIEEGKKNIVFVAGGMGVAPLKHLVTYLNNIEYSTPNSLFFYLGAQNASAVIGLEELVKYSCSVMVCTDDGSMGEKGLVTQIFQKDLKKYAPEDTIIFSCGPKEMLKSLAKILRGTKFNCQVSLEERMACGVGACLGCAVAVKSKKGATEYKRVCADGPVFDINKIVWK